MSNTLTQIAHKLKDANKKVQLIYAFNGSGKTRLSREFKDLIDPNTDTDETEGSTKKILYYNAYTEDLFYWDNDLENNATPTMKIHSNSFIHWILNDQGLGNRIIDNFKSLSNSKVEPVFNTTESTIIFNILGAFSREHFSDEFFDVGYENVRISKGEESNFIWSVFYTLLDAVVDILKEKPEDRESQKFNQLEYVFIDDPVSSLDDNHLIELAVKLSGLIKAANEANLKCIITTHNPLFYNVLSNELKLHKKKNGVCYLLEKLEDGTYNLDKTCGHSDQRFLYHLHLIEIIEKAIVDNKIEKFHFNLLRNLYEKTAVFLGYKKWEDLLPEDNRSAHERIMNLKSHSKIASEEARYPTESEKKIVSFLLNHLTKNYGFHQPKEDMKNTPLHADDVASQVIETKEVPHDTTH